MDPKSLLRGGSSVFDSASDHLVLKADGRGWCTYTDLMSAMRDELHHLVDQLPEGELRPALELIRGRVEHAGRDLPFFDSFEAEPDLAERSEEILQEELGR